MPTVLREIYQPVPSLLLLSEISERWWTQLNLRNYRARQQTSAVLMFPVEGQMSSPKDDYSVLIRGRYQLMEDAPR